MSENYNFCLYMADQKIMDLASSNTDFFPTFEEDVQSANWLIEEYVDGMKSLGKPIDAERLTRMHNILIRSCLRGARKNVNTLKEKPDYFALLSAESFLEKYIELTTKAGVRVNEQELIEMYELIANIYLRLSLGEYIKDDIMITGDAVDVNALEYNHKYCHHSDQAKELKANI